MINLLPPEIKRQQTFARYNVQLLRYMVLIFVVAGTMSLFVLGANFYARQRLNSLQSQLDAKQERMTEFEAIQDKADQINDQLTLVKNLLDQQSYYSNFINELAIATPEWAQIVRMNLNRATQDGGNSDQSLRVDIDFELTSLNRVSELQRELLAMERVDHVDIQNANAGDEDSLARATLALGLNTAPHQKLGEEDQQ